MKLKQKSGATIAMTAAALIMPAPPLWRRHRRHRQGPLLRRQWLQGPGQLQECQE